MKRTLTIAAAALAAAFTFSAPASAQVGTINGVGPARTANQPSTTGLGMVEGRSQYHGQRHHGWHAPPRHHGWHGHRGYHGHRGWHGHRGGWHHAPPRPHRHHGHWR